MHQIERAKLIHDRLNSFDKKKYDRKKKKLRENLNINKNVWFWQRELEKNQVWESFCKQSVQNISYFTRKNFSLEKRKKLIK